MTSRHNEDPRESLALARASAEQAISLDPDEPMAHFALGRVHIYSGEVEMGIAEMQSAIEINPSFAQCHHGLGWAYYYGAGQAEKALPYFDAALRLSPRSPSQWLTLMLKGSSLRMLGRHDEAVAYCRQACQFPNTGFLPHMNLAEALAEAGQRSLAQAAIAKAIQLQPSLSISFLRAQLVNLHETTFKSVVNSLKKAGLPE